jgi:hypothetical protein
MTEAKRCECCNRPLDDLEAMDEILDTVRADGAEQTQRLSGMWEDLRPIWERMRQVGGDRNE